MVKVLLIFALSVIIYQLTRAEVSDGQAQQERSPDEDSLEVRDNAEEVNTEKRQIIFPTWIPPVTPPPPPIWVRQSEEETVERSSDVDNSLEDRDVNPTCSDSTCTLPHPHPPHHHHHRRSSVEQRAEAFSRDSLVVRDNAEEVNTEKRLFIFPTRWVPYTIHPPPIWVRQSEEETVERSPEEDSPVVRDNAEEVNTEKRYRIIRPIYRPPKTPRPRPVWVRQSEEEN